MLTEVLSKILIFYQSSYTVLESYKIYKAVTKIVQTFGILHVYTFLQNLAILQQFTTFYKVVTKFLIFTKLLQWFLIFTQFTQCFKSLTTFLSFTQRTTCLQSFHKLYNLLVKKRHLFLPNCTWKHLFYNKQLQTHFVSQTFTKCLQHFGILGKVLRCSKCFFRDLQSLDKVLQIYRVF